MFNSLNMTQHTSDNLDSSRQKISAIIKFESQYQIPFNKSKSIKIAEFVRSNTFKNIRSDKTPRYSFKNHLKPMVKAHHIFDFNDKEDLEVLISKFHVFIYLKIRGF